MGSEEEPGEVARRLAREAEAFPDVVELSSGGFGTLATPVPGGRVHGVAVRADSVEIGVVVRFGRPLPEITAEMRRRLAPLAAGRIVHISVEDVIAGLGDGAGSG
ncbi:hypothetical protein [Nocardiopsis sp. ATB16-24]|uniref:hypothetical protein n=1 Tax=Nocardiopsis sp. ATB16-24 TaxID=3019555 RepID=UPI0025549EFC|nr:hypothetical protein [Nocardiopsis sp. ATB16-24]